MFRSFAWLSLVALAAASPARAQTLSLAQAQQLAADRSRQLAAQDLAASAAREMAVAAGQLPDPVLKLGVDNMPVTGPDQFSTTRDSMTMRRIGVMQEITRSAKRELRARRYEGEAQKSIAEKAATLADIERDAALAWLDRYYAEAMAGVLREEIAQAGLEVQAAEAAYRGARASQADVLAAHGSVAALQDRAAELASRVGVAKAGLARWIGRSADEPLADPPAMDAVPLDSAGLEAHLASHPEMTVLAKQEEIAETEARLAEASRTPDWTVEIAYQQRGPEFPNMMSFGISLPLPWDRGNRQDREAAAKLAQAEQARAQREEALRAHVGEVRAMLAEWQSGRERLARYRSELVPLARERARASLAAYEGGKTGITDLLAARRNESEVRLQAVQLESETARLWAKLTYLLPRTEGPQ